MAPRKVSSPRDIELLAPAKNVDIAIQAINHGADAVYIGASSHGARQSASNQIDDIKRLTEYAHQFSAKVYTTVNTIVYEHELKHVEKLIANLYHANVDAIIVQDMGVLRLDIPPIQLHASTQCDNRTIEKAKFLEAVGFSQIVLARELTLTEITEICSSVNVPIETFIHGALCVSYSGRCHASAYYRGRSANRGDCAQLCRLPYTLKDANDRILEKDKYLLSLRDFNLSDRIHELLNAGVSSFKIEGRLKDSTYVRNIVSYYRGIIDKEIESNPQLYRRSSIGKIDFDFTPQPDKSFNRGFTHYFLDDRKINQSIASLHTPKSLGERIEDINHINNGDGISFFNNCNEYTGFRVNKVVSNKIVPAQPISIPRNAELYRTFDVKWEKMMQRTTAIRKIGVDIKIDESGISATDQRGVYVRIPLDVTKEKAEKSFNPQPVFQKLGNTIYTLENFKSDLNKDTFIPISQLTEHRRQLIDLLDVVAKTSYKYEYSKPENKTYPYICDKLDYKENVANGLARLFYQDHGVKEIAKALEVSKDNLNSDIVVMTCRHCILRETGRCKRNSKESIKEPLTINSGNITFKLKFDCKNCEMLVIAPAMSSRKL